MPDIWLERFALAWVGYSAVMVVTLLCAVWFYPKPPAWFMAMFFGWAAASAGVVLGIVVESVK